MVAAVLCMATACHRSLVPATTPVTNLEIKNESGQLILAGHGSHSVLQQPNYKAWYDQSYNAYTTDTATVFQLKPLLNHTRMEVFLGSWCGDSKREVPHMLKVLQQAGMDTAKVLLVFVDNSIKNYKQSPQHEEKNRNIHHVPTFIVYDGNKEMGRIIESPRTSLEKDLLAILKTEPYQPNYEAIDHWMKQVKNRESILTDESLNNLVSELKPLCKHYGEFNTYGYVLLAANKSAEAINVFRLNTFIYPNTAGVFDSLGEAYEKFGNKPAAITAYEKVLLLKPTDENAKKRIVALRD
jgi:thiol-disulfide isomerase/thioredoxin